MSQPPLSFISACTRVLSSLVARRISRVVVRHPLPLPTHPPLPPLPAPPLYFLSPSLHMNTGAGSSGRRDEREPGDTRVPTESVPVGIPWSPSSQERARDLGQGTHDQYGKLADSYNDTTTLVLSSRLETLPLARVRGLLRTRVPI